jgi:hypothetical protein
MFDLKDFWITGPCCSGIFQRLGRIYNLHLQSRGVRKGKNE